MNREVKKTGKIVDELVTFLLLKQHNNIDIKINYESDGIHLKFKFDELNFEEDELLKNTLGQARDEQMEEYAWGLIGENDYACELNLLGMCIDNFKMIKQDDGSTIIEIYRKILE